MAGIYLHIPFCKQRCNYCAFHKSISLQAKEAMLGCLQKELIFRESYLNGEEIETIYFGGGTPTVYQPGEIENLINSIRNVFSVASDAEITLEANPDDLDETYLKALKHGSVNRLSIGVQSFHDRDLILMNRRHTGREAIDVIKNAGEIGFTNISVDLIYGLPGLTREKWQQNLQQVFNLHVQHISSYLLTFDPGTVFSGRLSRGEIKEVSEDECLGQYEILIDQALKNNFIHYELSNFCLEGYQSRHNSNYWKRKKYLGIGPSAHSYNLTEREWNIADNYKYMKLIQQQGTFSEVESLSLIDHYNDYVLTSLRTTLGLDLEYVKGQFGKDFFQLCSEVVKKYLKSSHVKIEKGRVVLTTQGFFISNTIMSDFFKIKEIPVHK